MGHTAEKKIYIYTMWDTLWPFVSWAAVAGTAWALWAMGFSCGAQHKIEKRKLDPCADERQYLDLVRRVLDEGAFRSDRTGTGTRALFGLSMRFDLRNGQLPMLTTKRVVWKSVLNELLWFISGSTNANELKTSIWKKNLSREALDSAGFPDREEGDLGPGYGFQWRHSGAEYKGMRADYTGKGVDQLGAVVAQIKARSHSRRLVVCSWVPGDVPRMSLPPCHCLFQFFVAHGELSCALYQRSADVGLGLPFNIASYALLTHMIAHVCDLEPREFVWFGGDTHVYSNHVTQLRKQLQRQPRPFPRVVLADKSTLEEFGMDDAKIVGYHPHPRIHMPQAL